MNDSLDLRNRILKMRESNNLSVSKEDSLNANLMSKFENSIKDDNPNKSYPSKNFKNDTNKEAISLSLAFSSTIKFVYVLVKAGFVKSAI